MNQKMTLLGAFTDALVLAITATTEQQSAKAVALAESFQRGLTPEQIECGKRTAELVTRGYSS